ncbi:hypothetical protein BDZ91DRAFT_725373 [Kalaharituber pfeilii]|nr:hypothetical protein BDZ91DRAFT_725373 [Kalaharituber pfeilii]
MTSLASTAIPPAQTSTSPVNTSNTSTAPLATPSTSGQSSTTIAAATAASRVAPTPPVSYAAATKKSSYTPPIVSSTVSPSPPVSGAQGPNACAPRTTNVSPVNGKTQVAPAVPTVTPTMSGNNTIVNGSTGPPNGHGRKSSIVSGIQFGSFPGNQPGQPVVGVPVASPNLTAPSVNPRISSPQMSPSLPQPAVSGGPVAQGMRDQNITFGSLGTANMPVGGDQRHHRPTSMPITPVAPAAQGPSHVRRESTNSHQQHPEIPQPGMGPNRAGMLPGGGRRNQGPPYGGPYNSQPQPFNNHNNYNSTNRAAPTNRGTYPSSINPTHYQQGQMGNFPSPQRPPPRSPAIHHSVPHTQHVQHSLPTTPQLNTVPMANSPSFQPANLYSVPHPHQFIPSNQHFDPGMYQGYSQMPQMYPPFSAPPPASPRNTYTAMAPPNPYTMGYTPQPMSRSSSAAASDMRPPSSFGMPHTPMTPPATAPHQPSAHRSDLFKKPSSKGIKITDPSTGAQVSSFKSPTPKSPPVVVFSTNPGPVIVSSGSPAPRPPAADITNKKTDEEKQREFITQVQKKKEEDEAREKELQRKKQEEEEERRRKEAEAAAEKKRQEEEEEKKRKEEEERLKREAEEKARLEEEEQKRKEEEAAAEAARIAKEKAEEEARIAKEKEEEAKRLQAEKEEAERKAREDEERKAREAEEAARLAREERSARLERRRSARLMRRRSGKRRRSKSGKPRRKRMQKPKVKLKLLLLLLLKKRQRSLLRNLKWPKLQSKRSPLTSQFLILWHQFLPKLQPLKRACVLRIAALSLLFVQHGLLEISTHPPENSSTRRIFCCSSKMSSQKKPTLNWDQLIRETVGEPTDSARPMSGRISSSLGPRSSSRGIGTASSQPPMGNFGAGRIGSILPPNMLTSEQRFAQSSRAPGTASSSALQNLGQFRSGPPSISRTSSSTGLPQQASSLPQSPRTRSSRGSKRGPGGVAMEKTESKQAEPKHVTTSPPADFKPLVLSENRWKPAIAAASGGGAAPSGPPGVAPPVPTEDNKLSPELVQRKVKAALNKMTPEKFDKISGQILEIASQSKFETDGRTLRQVIQLTFEKATDEAAWSSMYAKFCKVMMESIDPNIKDESIKDKAGKVVTGGSLFRKYLLNRCQEEFQRGWKVNLPPKPEGVTDEAAMLSDEYYIAAAAKRRGLGLIQFIGELFKLGMLTERIMHECVKKLVDYEGVPEEAEVESLCKLLRTIGSALDSTGKSRPMMDIYFKRIEQMINHPEIQSRLKFMLMDVVDLRNKGWNGNETDKGPKTLAEIHEDVLKQAAEKEAAARANTQRGGRPLGGRNDGRSFSQGGFGGQSDHPRLSNTVAQDDLRKLKQGARSVTSGQGTFGPPSFITSRSGSNPGKKMGPPSFTRGDDSGPTSRTATPPSGTQRETTISKNSFQVLGDMGFQANDGDVNDSVSPAPSAASSPPTVKAALAMRPLIGKSESK